MCWGAHLVAIPFFPLFGDFLIKNKTTHAACLHSSDFPKKQTNGHPHYHEGKDRVAACRTLLTRPLLLLADEPVSSLDPNLADRVLTNLKDSITSRNGCVVCALHNDEQVTKFANTVLRLDPSDPHGWKMENIKQDEKE